MGKGAGARALGLAAVTRNMIHAFARNISESRDWCMFWEIDKRGAPCPVDYRDDSSFWYNLPANFDVLQACFREYLWTGDRTYIDDPTFRHFHDATVTSYMDAWDRDGDGIPEYRPEYGVRGLGSYDEGKNGQACLVGGDLVALQFAAYQAYSEIMALQGSPTEAERFRAKARLLRELYNAQWWDARRGIFSSIMLQDRSFAPDFSPESQVFPLICGIVEQGPKADAMLDALIRALSGANIPRSPLPSSDRSQWDSWASSPMRAKTSRQRSRGSRRTPRGLSWGACLY